MFATIFSFSRLTSSRHFDSSDVGGGGTFGSLGCSGVTTGGWLGRSGFEEDFFERSLDRANALLVLCSTGGNPVFGAGDLDDEGVDPGVLSRTDPTSWTFFVEASGMRSLVVGVLVKGSEWIEGHESNPVLDADGIAIHDKLMR